MSRRQHGGLIEDAEVVDREARWVIHGLETVGDMSAITAALERVYPDPAERAQIFRRVMEIGGELHAELTAAADVDPVEAAARRVFEAITRDTQIDGRDPLDWAEHEFPHHFNEILAAATTMAGGAADGEDAGEWAAGEAALGQLEDMMHDFTNDVVNAPTAIQMTEQHAAAVSQVRRIIDDANDALEGAGVADWDAFSNAIYAGMDLLDEVRAELWPATPAADFAEKARGGAIRR